MKKSSADQKKKSRKYKLRNRFAAAVASVALLGGVGAHVAYDMYSPPANEPAAVQVFGATADWTPLSPLMVDWNNMLQQQQHYMQNPPDAAQFKEYLAGFDYLKGATLSEMANDVNTAVLANLHYNDTKHALSFFYWASPFQTVKTGAGDCKAYAALQYSIMRHLGVPEDRLFIAIVGQGDNLHIGTQDDPHAVLLVNIAPEGHKQNFIVMNDGGPVVEANNYTHPHGTASWSRPYELLAVLNGQGLWLRNPLTAAGAEVGALVRDAPAIEKAAVSAVARGLNSLIPKLG